MGFINFESLKQKEIIFWIATQITFLPILTPKSFAGFGIGNPNGSLWTIAVELQFYLAIPLLYYLIRKHTRWIQNAILIVLAFVSWYAGYRSKTMNADSVLATIYISSLIPYLHFFIYGILLFVNFDVLKRFVVNRAQYWVLGLFQFCCAFSLWTALVRGRVFSFPVFSVGYVSFECYRYCMCLYTPTDSNKSIAA
jgi:peptidoglycan/LPS O-acetylase OafA/YrhL